MVRAIVGANWGDEGKGKITDMLAKESDIIIRFQGGSNAGHTIINDYGKFALHLLPSGVFYQHTTSIIGNGVALNIPYLIKEIQSIVDRGVPKPHILVSDRAQILMPYHVLFDTYEEARLAGKSFGSTKSGIAPFYSDKYAKIGFQVSELFDDDLLKEKTERVCEIKNVLLEHLYHKPLLDPKELYDELVTYREMIRPYVCDVSAYLHNAIKEGKKILLEGQLGSLKDPDHGIYPMVTSSSTLAAYGAIGAGIPPYEIKDITTVVKAYSSAVGAGAFVSEIFGDEADELRRRGGDGGEFVHLTPGSGLRSLRHFSITKKLAINGHDYVSLAKDTAHRQLGTIQDYYETPEDSVRIDTAKAIGKLLIRSDESDSESQVTISLEDEDFAKKLEEVASDSAGKQMLEFAIAMYEKNNSD